MEGLLYDQQQDNLLDTRASFGDILATPSSPWQCGYAYQQHLANLAFESAPQVRTNGLTRIFPVISGVILCRVLGPALTLTLTGSTSRQPAGPRCDANESSLRNITGI